MVTKPHPLVSNNKIQKTMPLAYRHKWVWYHARTIG